MMDAAIPDLEGNGSCVLSGPLSDLGLNTPTRGSFISVGAAVLLCADFSLPPCSLGEELRRRK